ncbi:MAG TPA: hypothetical protein VF188_05755 [Longimicrobiales bacterium]
MSTRERKCAAGWRPLLAAVVMACALAPGPAFSQVAAADTAAIIYDVARRLEAEGRAELAAALYERILARYAGTAAAQAADARLGALRDRRLERGGQVELMVWGTAYGLWLGAAVPAMLGEDRPEPYGLGLLTGGPIGFLAARSYARSHSLSVGQARAITFGGTWGTWQGYGWREVLDIGRRVDRNCTDSVPQECFEIIEESTSAPFTAAVLGGLAGMGIGTIIARSHEISPGVATAVNSGAVWGVWFGFTLGELADAEGDALLGTTLAAGDAALVAMALLAPRWNPSRARVRLVSIAGVAGALGGLGLDLLGEVDDEDIAILLPMLGSVAGLWLGSYWTRDREDAHPGAEPGESGGPAGALLEVRGGRAVWGLPLPMPARLRGPRPTEWEPGVRLMLIAARF